MLDRATLERLSRNPEQNAPTLNVALAEEGAADVLLSLARAPGVGPEALEIIDARVREDGPAVGLREEESDEAPAPIDGELDRLLIAHPRASDGVRDGVLERHADDAFFVLAAACHPRATVAALERAADWPSASPVHDRLWIAMIDPKACPPLVLEEWSTDPSPLRREAAARIARDAALLERLAQDPSRQVRRAVASNFVFSHRAELAANDVAAEVRARAQSPLAQHDASSGASLVESARFAAAHRVMATGGLVAPDVVRALSTSARALDSEGATLAGQVLPRRDLAALIEEVATTDVDPQVALGLAAGIALRAPIPLGTRDEDAQAEESEHTELVYDAVKCLSHGATNESALTGKARFAAWAANGFVHRANALGPAALLVELGRRPLAAERMILARGASKAEALVVALVGASGARDVVPAALLELAWGDAKVVDTELAPIAARVAPPKKRSEDLPEDEIDLDPSARPLEVLEQVVLAATQRANVSPRAALAAVALDARRVRYVLAAMPQWKGRLTGGRLARVLRQHGAALSVAHAETRAREARVERWTERLLSELELAVALAVGHLTFAEVARRITLGRQIVDDGLNLAFGAEARAALEGRASAAPILEWATKHRSSNGPAFAVWLLLERFDRERAPAIIAASVDTLTSAAGRAPPSVIDALAAVEHRKPGRLETIPAQSPRGRAALASAIARAYRALGGTREERQG